MPSSETKRRLAAGGVFLLPLGLLWAAANLFGGPRSVQGQAPAAATPPVPTPIAPNGAPVLDAEQRAAAAYLAALAQEPFGATPLYFEPRELGPEIVDDGTEDLFPMSLTIQAVVASPRGTVALIDGKTRRRGDEIPGSAWRIAAIDAEARSVTFEHATTGRTITRHVPQNFQ
jgi:hypothetical protein